MSGIIAQNTLSGSGLVKAVEASGGTWVAIKTLTSDGSDATMSFVDGTDDVVLDGTYPIYKFDFINIHPETDSTEFQFNGSTDSGSNYNVTKTSTSFFAFHYEDASSTSFGYSAANDLAQGTGFQNLADDVGNDNDQSASGFLYLYNPASTVFVKHFINTSVHSMDDNRVNNRRQVGYLNTTSAVNAIQFKMSADEIQGGKIKLFGLKDSA